MYPNPYGANAYTQASQNVSPMKAVIMLYEGLIRLIGEAKTHHENGDFEARFHAVEKASRIVLGLQGQLDFDNGGDISPILHEFYDTLFMRMMQINSREPEKVFVDVISSITEMKKTWEEVAKKTENDHRESGVSDQSKYPSDKGMAEGMPSGSSFNV